MTVKRRSGRWTIDVCLPDGTRIRRVSPVQTRAGALAFEAEVRASIAAQQAALLAPPPATPATPTGVPTLAEFAPEWLTVYAAVNNKPSEVVSKESTLRNHLVPFFGQLKLDAIDGRTIERYKASRLRGVGCKKPLKAKTVNNHLIILSKQLATAQEWGIIEKLVKVRRLPVGEQEFDWLKPHESKRLLAAVDAYYPQWSALFWTALHTGLRCGELFALRWGDVEFDEQRVWVRRSVYKKRLVPPKGNRIRDVPMSRRLTAVLAAYHEIRRRGVYRERSDYLWPRVDGSLTTHQDHVNRPLVGALKRAQLRSIRFHDLRHTFASQLVSAGRSIQEVQVLLGHTSIQVTMRYAHLAPGRMRAAVAVLDEDDVG